MKTEVNAVKWYIEVMERGQDTRNVIQDYFKACDKIVTLEGQLKKLEEQTEQKLQNATRKIQKMFSKLRM